MAYIGSGENENDAKRFPGLLHLRVRYTSSQGSTLLCSTKERTYILEIPYENYANQIKGNACVTSNH